MRLTSTAPVRLHLDKLRKEAGLGTRRIAELAGVSRTGVEGARRNERMYPYIAAAILAVQPREVLPRHLVDATGTRRRMRALVALGWSFREQALNAGIAVDPYRRSAGVGGVRLATARMVGDVYDRLSMVRPDGRAAGWSRQFAHRCGWFPPLAWDDDRIDDPDALPCLLPPVRPCSRELELAVQHVAAGHDVEVTTAVRRELILRTSDRPMKVVAELARCSYEIVRRHRLGAAA